MIRAFAFLLTFLLWTQGAAAGAGSRVQDLFNALYLPELIAVMRVEGLEYGEEISEDLLAGRGGESWQRDVARIYDADRLGTEMLEEMAERLTDEDLDSLLPYYNEGPGGRLAELEMLARRDLLSDEAEAEAHNLVEYLREEKDPRLDLLAEFSNKNHLIDLNVTGALNASYEFYFGLIDSGAMPVEMTEREVLADVWSQEPEIREEIGKWLEAYQLLAYETLSAEEVRSYLDFTQTDAGRALNACLFESFDVVFRRISRELGLAAGQRLASEEI